MTLWQIAVYEMKFLSREWGFRMIAGIAVVLVFMVQLMAQGNLKTPDWIAVSIPSAIPFANAYLTGLFQLLIILFWGAAFIRKHRSCGSEDSLFVRPFSNTEYLWGKVIGFCWVLCLLDLLLLGCGLIVHLLLSESLFAFGPYLFYFFTFTLPILIFALGIVVCIKGMISSRALALGVLSLVFFGIVRYASGCLFGVLDVFARSLPNVFSDVVGFAGLELYLLQRGVLLLVGGTFICWGIYAIRRLPDGKKMGVRGGICGAILLLFALVLGGVYCHYFEGKQAKRMAYRQVFERYENSPLVHVEDHHIQFRQMGTGVEIESRMRLCNQQDQRLDKFVFYLNPALEVVELLGDKGTVAFQRDEQVLVVDYSLEAGERKELIVRYAGGIDPDVCYAEIENREGMEKYRRYSILQLGTDFHYLDSEYTLLTPECLWYPVNVPPVNVTTPYTTPRDYTRFTLAVIGERVRVPVSQGEMEVSGDTVYFRNEKKLEGISLGIGNYTRRSLESNGLLFELYLLKGHEYLADQFSNPEMLAAKWRMSFMFNPDIDYGFKKLSLVEVPVHFCAYSRSWKANSEYVQPELVFRPEWESLGVRFRVGTLDESGRGGPVVIPEGDDVNWEDFTFVQYQNNFKETRPLVEGNFLFGGKLFGEQVKNEYDLAHLYRKKHIYVNSADFPGIDLLIQKMQSKLTLMRSSFSHAPGTGKVSDVLKGGNLLTVLSGQVESVPVEEIMEVKSVAFMQRLLTKISYDNFHRFMQERVGRYNFDRLDYGVLCRDFETEFGIDLHAFTRAIYEEQGMPSFRFRDFKVEEYAHIDGESGLVASVKVWNRGNVDGVLAVAMMRRPNLYYLIPAGACVEIRTDLGRVRPKEKLELQTGFAENMPGVQVYELQVAGRTKDVREGVYAADTSLFLSPANEYIVDDRDPGFRVMTNERLLKNARGWLFRVNNKGGGYGEPVCGCHMKYAGEGNSGVEWNVVLPEAGEYELFVYHDGELFEMMNGSKRGAGQPLMMQTYTFTREGGEECVVLEESELLQTGWISLGKYYFRAGENRVTLSDKAAAKQRLFADAVKWVKR